MRIGIGFDIHKLAKERALILGGVKIPSELGLLGHSDADVLTHAIIDSILGAKALGNIGQHFPDTDPKYKDADSLELLRETLNFANCEIINLDCNIIAQSPKLNPYIDLMRENLAHVLNISKDKISIKPKTNENLDSIGHNEAISAQAVVLVE